MDIRPAPTNLTAAEALGRLIGGAIVASAIVIVASLVLLASWNKCAPQVFGASEISLSQSLSMLGVAWTLTAITRLRA